MWLRLTLTVSPCVYCSLTGDCPASFMHLFLIISLFSPIFLGEGHVLPNNSSIAVQGVGKNLPLVLEGLKIPWLEQVPQSWWRVRITKTR